MMDANLTERSPGCAARAYDGSHQTSTNNPGGYSGTGPNAGNFNHSGCNEQMRPRSKRFQEYFSLELPGATPSGSARSKMLLDLSREPRRCSRA